MEIIGASILASVITTKILATYYFKKVDGYVKEMCEMTTKPFWYWTVKGRDYRLKLKASTIGKLENKYRQNIMNLVEDMPSLSVMLTIIQAAMEPWEHGIDYPDIQKIYDSWTEEGGNQVDLFKKVVIPTLVVSGFFPEKQAQSIMEELENQ